MFGRFGGRCWGHVWEFFFWGENSEKCSDSVREGF